MIIQMEPLKILTQSWKNLNACKKQMLNTQSICQKIVEYKPQTHSLARRPMPYSPVSIFATKFKLLLYESTNSSEARFHEVIRTIEDVYITGYVSNDPELQKNQQFVLKDKDSFEKWKLSVAKHPKAEIRIDLVRSMESITSDSISGSSLSQISMIVGNKTKARIKALMAQLVKEYPINNKYSKESSVYINTSNPKEYIHIKY
ncbi:hypothetical protein BY996DRAFT_6419481 [Phakopsora pachyrhizi]|nr:hypothetical protein BY996DRAFT_6419481 [Phakopsora pachyrhizi]